MRKIALVRIKNTVIKYNDSEKKYFSKLKELLITAM